MVCWLLKGVWCGGGVVIPLKKDHNLSLKKWYYECLTDIDKWVRKNPKHLKKYVFGLDHLFQVECWFREEIEEHVKKGLDYLFPDHEYSKFSCSGKAVGRNERHLENERKCQLLKNILEVWDEELLYSIIWSMGVSVMRR